MVGLTNRKPKAGVALTNCQPGRSWYVVGCWRVDRNEWELIEIGYGVHPRWDGRTCNDFSRAFRWKSRQAAWKFLRTGEHRRFVKEHVIINLSSIGVIV